MLLFIFVKLYYAGTVCACRRARLLVCFDRPVGWKQAVRLHLIKPFNLAVLSHRLRGLSRQEKPRADPRVVATRNRNSELTNPSATKQRKRQRTCMGKARRLQVAVLAARGRKGGGLLDRQPVSSG